MLQAIPYFHEVFLPSKGHSLGWPGSFKDWLPAISLQETLEKGFGGLQWCVVCLLDGEIEQ